MSASRFLRPRGVVVAVFIVAFALTACGDFSDSESDAAAAPSATTAEEAATTTATQDSTATAASNTPSAPPAATLEPTVAAGASTPAIEPTASPTAMSTPTTGPAADPTATESTADTDRVEVIIDQFAFAPAMLEIPVGTTVVFTNRDPFVHTATETEFPYLFDSGNLNTGDSFEFTFDTPGTYEYFCLLHPTMLGTIVVS